MKKCFKCGILKPLSEFYRHSQMGDGHLNKCILCARRDVDLHRMNNAERIREYDRARPKRPIREAIRRYNEAYPDRAYAKRLVEAARKNGSLRSEPCFLCGEKAHAHHAAYDLPLHVTWLCPLHHKQAHALGKVLQENACRQL